MKDDSSFEAVKMNIVLSLLTLVLGISIWSWVREAYFYRPQTVLSISNKMIDINMAPRDELVLISGVGPAKAEKIVNYRNIRRISTFEEFCAIVSLPSFKKKEARGQVTFSSK